MASKPTLTVHALSGGSLTLSEKFFITPSSPTAKFLVPSLCFLIQHTPAPSPSTPHPKTTRLILDLGLRRDLSQYPESLQRHCTGRQPMSTTPDVVESLALGNLTPKDIDYVILSHVHYDHVGTPSDFPPPTKFIIGPGAADLLSGKTRLDIGSHSVFEPDLLPFDRTVSLPLPEARSQSSSPWAWQPFSLFPHAIDLFSDSSLFIISAPGHLPGHINILAPHASSSGSSLYLAGDACHDIRLFRGERDIATWVDDEGRDCCIHADVPTALETLARLRELAGGKDEELGEVEVVFAHNWAWETEARKEGRFWPGRM
jgi:glyoxylase-like metal-dependent hydrolase (beta-lactamase superfamily II)